MDTFSLHNGTALIENNDGFPRLLTPRELSQAVVSNVLRRRLQSSRVCARICLQRQHCVHTTCTFIISLPFLIQSRNEVTDVSFILGVNIIV